MTEARLISVVIPFENVDPEDGVTERGEDHYWAVKPPEDTWGVVLADGTDQGARTLPTGYHIMGSSDVQVYNKETLQGLRELLDRIEEDLGESE